MKTIFTLLLVFFVGIQLLGNDKHRLLILADMGNEQDEELSQLKSLYRLRKNW